MTRLKARIMVIVAAALVGAVAVPFAVANKGADDPAGHVRHAKKHDKKAASKKKGKKGTKAQKGQKGNAGTTSKGREASRGDRGRRPSRVTTGVRAARGGEPSGDDRGQQAEPGDDRGQDAQAEAGDDRGGHGNDDGSGHN